MGGIVSLRFVDNFFPESYSAASSLMHESIE